MRASFALPFARFALAEATKEAIGVSGGISEGEMAEQKWTVRNVAPQASDTNRVIILRFERSTMRQSRRRSKAYKQAVNNIETYLTSVSSGLSRRYIRMTLEPSQP